MARKKKEAPVEEPIVEKEPEQVHVYDYLGQSVLNYAMSVIVARALPDVRDGFKPVHRRIIYDMYKMGLTSNVPHKKCATTVGDVLGHYHPHGDSSVYDAQVRLAQDFSMRYPLVDGHGNFGSIDGDQAAAYRYTEARLAKIAAEVTRDIDKATVDWVPNFDGSEMEPSVLPCRFPNLLVNGSQGIAVGMACNIPPHNMTEVCDAVLKMLKNDMKDKDTTFEEILDIIQGPDFPTGAVMLGDSWKQIYRTGKGSVTMQAVYHIEDEGKKSSIVFTELPYQVNKRELVESIAKYSKEKKLDVSDVRDETDKNGIRVVVELKNRAIPELVLNNLLQHTRLRCNFNANMLCLVDGKPMQLNILQFIRYYIDHQLEVVSRRTVFEKDKANKRLHIVEGLLIAIDHIDEIIDIIKHSVDDNADALTTLMDRFGLSEEQAQTILDMRLRALSGLGRAKLETEHETLINEIARCEKVLGDKHELMKLVSKELREVRNKYGDDRRTKHVADYSDITMEDLIEDEPCVVIRTKIGYLKRMKPSALRLQKRYGKGSHLATISEDYVEDMISTSLLSDIVFFSNFGRVYSTKAYKLAETSRTARGTALVSLLKLQPGEEITNMIAEKEYSEDTSLVLFTKNGITKRVALNNLQNVRITGRNIINLDEGDEVCGTLIVTDADYIQVTTKFGYCAAYAVANIRAMGTSARGVKGIKLTDGDEVVSIQKRELGREVMVITEKGYAKRVKCEDFTVFVGRTARGSRCIKKDSMERVGYVTKVFLIEDPSNDLVITMDNGQIIKTPINKVPVYSRSAMGLRMINISDNPDGVVADVAATSHEEPNEDMDDEDIEDTTVETTEENAEVSESDENTEETVEEPDDTDVSEDESTGVASTESDDELEE